MTIPTENERRAQYHADMAATVAAGGPSDELHNNQSRKDTVGQIQKMQHAQALEAALTPVEQIQVDMHARRLLREHARVAGRPAPGSSELSIAGARAIHQARLDKVRAAQ